MTTASIALATYNGEKFLPRQLETLATQTRLPDELVVCDDGSTDGTLEILRQFAETAPFPVRIFQNLKNLGPGRNFRKAFSMCSGDVTFFCDQDDVWFPEKLEKALAVLDAEPEVGLVLLCDIRVDANENPLRLRHRDRRFASAVRRRNDFQSLYRSHQFGWALHNMACRTAWFETLFPEDAPQAADFIDSWIFRVMGALSNVRVVLEPTMAFRRHGGNFTTHSGHEKNPAKLLERSLKRHMNAARLWERTSNCRQVIAFLESCGKPIAHPEALALYRRHVQHEERRADAIAHPGRRLELILREILNGNYCRFSRLVRDPLTDLLIWPQKQPTETDR